MATIWTDDPITRDILIKRIHIVELQNNVNRLRRAKSQPDYVFINIPVIEGIVKDIHIIEIKNVLNQIYPNISWNYDFTNISSEQAKCDHVAELRRQINIIDGVLVEYKSSALDWFFHLEDEDSKLTGYGNDLIAFEYECPTSYDLTSLVTPIISGLTAGNHVTPMVYTITTLDPNYSSITWEADGSPTITSGQLVGGNSNKITLHWQTPGTYNIRCKLIGNQTEFGDSNWSNVITTVITYAITPLEKPNITSINPSSGGLINTNIIITCNTVTNAISYTWDCGSNFVINAGSGTNQITGTWSQAGTYYIKVRANGNGTTYSNSPWSNEATYILSASKPQLSQPSITCNDADLKITPNQIVGFICTFDNSTQSISWNISGSYTVISGQVSGSRTNNIQLSWASAGTYYVNCKTIATGFEDSIYSNTITLTCQPVIIDPVIIGPADISMGSNCFYQISNGPHVDATSFVWQISGPQYIVYSGAIQGSNQESIGIRHSANGECNISCKKITSVGESNFSNTIKTLVTNIQITLPKVSSITSTFDSTPSVTTGTQCSFSAYGDSRASSLEWSITGSYTLHAGTLTNAPINSTIVVSWGSAGSYTVSVRNVGDGTNYITSGWTTENAIVQVASTKLATPTPVLTTTGLGYDAIYSNYFVEANNGTITYNLTSAIPNATKYEWDLGQPCYIVNGEEVGQTVTRAHTTGLTLSFKPTAAGFGIAVQCCAVGDGITYLTSDYSSWVGYVAVKHPTELPTPQLQHTAGSTLTKDTAVTFDVLVGSRDDKTAQYIWSATQDGLTVISGYLSGSANPTISLKWSTQGSKQVNCLAAAKFYKNSAYSNPVIISVINNSVQLSAPTITPSSTTVSSNQNVTLSVSPIANAVSYTWSYADITPTIVSGGNGSTSVTLKYTITSATARVQCKAVGDGAIYLDSNWSSFTTITITPSTTKLPTPSFAPDFTNDISNDKRAYTISSLTFNPTTVPSNTTELIWAYTGSPTVISSRAATGISNWFITLKWTTPGSYTVKYALKGNGTTYLDSDYSPTRTFTVIQSVKLATPVISNPADSTIDSLVSYTCTSVTNATAYAWEFTSGYLNGNTVANLVTSYTNTTPNLPIKWASAGTKTVKVRAATPLNEMYEPSDYATDTIVINTATPMLGVATVTGPDTFTTTSGMVNEYTASTVSNATSYSWLFSPNTNDIAMTGVSGTNFQKIKVGITKAGTYTIAAKAAASGYQTNPSAPTKTITVTAGAIKLATPVFVGGYPAIWYLGDTIGGKYTVIPPTGASMMSFVSKESVLFSTDGATYSTLRSADLSVVPGTNKSFWLKSATSGTFSCTLAYISNQSGYSNSDPLNFDFICQGTKLPAPGVNFSVTSATVNTNINVWATPANITNAVTLLWTFTGCAYTLVSGSLSGAKGNLTVKYTATGTSTVTCKSIGNGGTYADSDVSTASLTVGNGVKLATPVISANPTTATFGTNVVFSVGAIANASSYSWGFDTIPGVTRTVIAGAYTGSTATSITIRFDGSANCTMSGICQAIGNGTTYYSSNLSNAATISLKVPATKLAAPTITTPNITPTQCIINSNKLFVCSAVTNASSYLWAITGTPTVVAGLGTTSITVKWANIGSYTAKVQAIGDYINYSNSDYSSTYTVNVIELIKLATPVISAPSSANINSTTIFAITPISNASSYTWNVTGSYTIKSGTISGGTASNLDLAWGTAGTYTVQCMAIGNGSVYTNSDWSAAKSISITALPSIGTPSLSSSSGTFVKFGSAVGFSVTVPTGATSIKLSYTSNGSLTYCYNNANGTFQNLPSSGYVYSVIPGSTVSYYFKADNYLGTSCNISVEWGYDPFNYTIGGKATFTININKATLPTPVITKSPNVSSVIAGNSVTFSIAAIANAGSYILTGLKNGIQQFTGSTTSLSKSIGFTSTDLGTWTIEYTAVPSDTINYQNSAKATTTVAVFNPTQLATPVISGSAGMYCVGTQVYTIAAIPNATSYTWSGSGLTSINPTGDGLTCIVATTTLGTKTLSCIAKGTGYTDSNAGSKTITSQVLTFPSPVITVPTTGLKNTNITLHVDAYATGTSSFQWNVSGSPTFVSGAASGVLVPTTVVKWAAAGTYSVQVRCVGNGTTTLTGAYCAAKTITIT